MTDTPEIGQTVHYVSYGTPAGEYPSVCRAAIVTELIGRGPAADVMIAILNPHGLNFTGAPHDDADHAGGSWHRIGECPR